MEQTIANVDQSSRRNLHEHFQFIKHLRRLSNHRFGNWSFFVQFGIVGFSGTIVNLAVLSVLNIFGVYLPISIATAILVSMTSNFFLNRIITFSYAKAEGLSKQFGQFVLASSFGTLVNYAVTLTLASQFPLFSRWPQLAAVVGILAGMCFNFFSSRYWVFRQKTSPQL